MWSQLEPWRQSGVRISSWDACGDLTHPLAWQGSGGMAGSEWWSHLDLAYADWSSLQTAPSPAGSERTWYWRTYWSWCGAPPRWKHSLLPHQAGKWKYIYKTFCFLSYSYSVLAADPHGLLLLYTCCTCRIWYSQHKGLGSMIHLAVFWGHILHRWVGRYWQTTFPSGLWVIHP